MTTTTRDMKSPFVTLSKTISFSSSHQLVDPSLSESENILLYDKCTAIHGHNYTLTVTLKSTLTNGYVIDAKRLKSIMTEAVKDLDHHHLNDVLILPTCERLVVLIWERIAKLLGDRKSSLYRVDLKETDSISCSFSGEYQ